MNTDPPKAGEPFTTAHFEMVLDAVQDRQKNFPDEPAVISMGLVLGNIGDRFSEVICAEGEFMGVKSDISVEEGSPTCPNGHALSQVNRLRLGWILDE